MLAAPDVARVEHPLGVAAGPLVADSLIAEQPPRFDMVRIEAQRAARMPQGRGDVFCFDRGTGELKLRLRGGGVLCRLLAGGGVVNVAGDVERRAELVRVRTAANEHA